MRKHVLSAILCIILIFILTYPLFLNIGRFIPSFFSADEPYGNIWEIWRINYSIFNKISIRSTQLIAFPFGLDMYSSAYISYLWVVLVYLMNLFLKPLVIYNLQLITNLLLSFVFTYLIVYILTRGNFSTAIFSGIIFALCSFQFARMWQHLGLTYVEWIPSSLFGLILLRKSFNRRNILIFIISLFCLYSFDWNIMYIATITILSFLTFIILYNIKLHFINKKNIEYTDFAFVGKTVLLGIIIFIVFSFQFLPVIINRITLSGVTEAAAYNPYRRPLNDLFSQSAKPLSYFLPAATHPLFGRFTENFVGTELYGDSFTEHALYLGWTPLALAFIALRRWRRNRKAEDFYIGFFIFLAIIAWLFSQPPWWKIGPIRIFMPSSFMYKILPMFRAYCRFGIVVMLAVAVLAGFGLKFILERFKSKKAKICVTTLLCGLVLFEFWNYPPFKVIDVSKVPEVYYWLKEQPRDIVIAEYPLDADSPNEMYKFYQTEHEKRIVNGTIPGTFANRIAEAITRLSEPRTAESLKWMGVKYVLVHTEDYKKTGLIEWREELNKIPQNPGLKFVKSFPSQNCPRKDIMCVRETGPVDVYEVVAQSVKPEVKQ